MVLTRSAYKAVMEQQRDVNMQSADSNLEVTDHVTDNTAAEQAIDRSLLDTAERLTTQSAVSPTEEIGSPPLDPLLIIMQKLESMQKAQNEANTEMTRQISGFQKAQNEAKNELTQQISQLSSRVDELAKVRRQVELIPSIVKHQSEVQVKVNEIIQRQQTMSNEVSELKETQDKFPDQISKLDESINNIRDRQESVELQIAEFASKLEDVSLGKEERSRQQENVAPFVKEDLHKLIDDRIKFTIDTLSEELSDNPFKRGMDEVREPLENTRREIDSVRGAVNFTNREFSLSRHNLPSRTNQFGNEHHNRDTISSRCEVSEPVTVKRTYSSTNMEEKMLKHRQFQIFNPDKRTVNPVVFMRSFRNALPKAWTDEQKISFVIGFIHGEGGMWANDVMYSCRTFEDFEQAFLAKYWSRGVQERLRQEVMYPEPFSFSRGTLRRYFEKYLNKCRYWDEPLPQKDVLNILKARLPKDVRKQLLHVPYDNIDDFFTVLDELDLINEDHEPLGNRWHNDYSNNYCNNHNNDRSGNGRKWNSNNINQRSTQDQNYIGNTENQANFGNVGNWKMNSNKFNRTNKRYNPTYSNQNYRSPQQQQQWYTNQNIDQPNQNTQFSHQNNDWRNYSPIITEVTDDVTHSRKPPSSN